MRSCLVLPEDLRPEKAIATGADALVVDLRAQNLAGALSVLRQGGKARPRPALFVRLGPLPDPAVEAALEVMIEAPPDGVFLDGAEDGASIQNLGAKLAVFEARAGLPDGATSIVAHAAHAPSAVFALASFCNSSARLRALAFARDALTSALGVEEPCATLDLARGLLVLAARAAGAPALDAPCRVQKNAALLREECLEARRNGFAGKLAVAPEEVAIINEIFAPAG